MKNLDHLFTLAEQNVAQVILSAPKLSNQEHIYGEWKPCFGERQTVLVVHMLQKYLEYPKSIQFKVYLSSSTSFQITLMNCAERVGLSAPRYLMS